MSRPAFALSGRRFGRLVALRRFAADRPGFRRDVFWECRCDCGSRRDVRSFHLTSGAVVSCGCWNKEQVKRSRSNGGVLRKEHQLTYSSWRAMIKRCQHHGHVAYMNYGGRGIIVCERWLNFANFLSDMGSRPPGLLLERVNNDIGYEPGNCVWATSSTQNRNTRRNRLLTINGETFCAAEWSDRSGVSQSTIFSRIKRGWEPARAVWTPVKR